MSAPAAKLLVVLLDPLTVLIEKGETVPRYYNPGDVFDEVHFMLLNADRPVIDDRVRSLVGRARPIMHNVTPPRWFMPRTLGWQPFLVRRWARHAVAAARAIRPAVVRAYNPWLDGFVCVEIKRSLGTPYMLSLHGDVDSLRGGLARTVKDRLYGRAMQLLENVAVPAADIAMPVYSTILPYLKRMAARRVELAYNVVGQGAVPKHSYAVDKSRVMALCVGRQQSLLKDPSAILRAAAGLPWLFLTLIGTGDLHMSLRTLARELGIQDRVTFVPRMENAEILRIMPGFDLYLYSLIPDGISKTCMEAALCGLPVIVNDHGGQPAMELTGGHFRLVENTPEAYRRAIVELIENDEARAALGRAGRAHASAAWHPDITEARQAALNREALAAYHRHVGAAA